MAKEIWKEIAHTEGLYQVSNLGRLRSYAKRADGKPEILKGRKKGTDFIRMELTIDKIHYQCLMHRLVAQAFIENPDPKKYVYVVHLDRDKQNNRVENLKWVSKEEWNTINKESKLGAIGKLKAEQIPDIRSRYAAGERTVVLAEEYGVTPMQINRVIRGESWGHIGKEATISESKS